MKPGPLVASACCGAGVRTGPAPSLAPLLETDRPGAQHDDQRKRGEVDHARRPVAERPREAERHACGQRERDGDGMATGADTF